LGVALVLCTGIDEALLRTRKLILERAGHIVVTVSDEKETAAACQEHCFDVAVIGQAIAPKVKKRVASLVRQHCRSAKLLELYRPHEGRIIEDADSWLLVPTDVPQDLAEHVNNLVAKN
jgi:hypothetical protein